MAKLSGRGGVSDSTDDSLLMLSYSTDGGQTFETKKIRIEDLFDDIELDNLADVDLTAVAPTDGQALVWDNVNQIWEPGDVATGPIAETARLIDADITLTSGKNGVSVGTTTIDNGITVEIPQDGEWLVLDGPVAAGGDLASSVIKTRYEENSDTNAFTDADHSKLDGIEAGAQVNTVTSVNGQTGAVTVQGFSGDYDDLTNKPTIPTIDPDTVIDANYVATDENFTTADHSKLDGIEAGATADQTGAEIKAAYEAENDTNAFTDADQTKLTGIEAGAEVNTVSSVAGRTGAVTLAKGDVGLGNVDNTADTDKPVSTAQQTALDAKADLVNGVVPNSQLPSVALTEYLGSAADQTAMLALSGQEGDWAIRTDLGSTWVITGSDPTQLSSWTELATPASDVTSVNGYQGTVVLGSSDVGAVPATGGQFTGNLEIGTGIDLGTDGAATFGANVNAAQFYATISGDYAFRANSRGGYYVDGSGNEYLYVRDGSGSQPTITLDGNGGDAYFAEEKIWLRDDGGITTFGNRIQARSSTANSTDKFFSGASNATSVSSGSTERFAVYTDGSAKFSGNVGIGLDNPQEELHIKAVTPVVRLEDSDGTNQYGQMYQGGATCYFLSRNNTSNGLFQFNGYDGTGMTKFLQSNTVGEWGIGGSDPVSGYKLNTTGIIRADGGFNVNGNTVWHAGNDGAGSGLDADTLDGLHASSFLRTSGDITHESGKAVFGSGTQTADGDHDISLFATSPTSFTGQSGAFRSKLRLFGGSSQTRDLQLWQENSGGAHISTSWTGNNLTFDNAFQFVEFDQRVIIDADNASAGALQIRNNVTDTDSDLYFALEIDQSLTGTNATTGDREQGGIYMNIDSSATGGNTSEEHRAYGIFIDLDTTGDADLVAGVYADSVATPQAGTTTNVYGLYGRAEDNGGAGSVSSVYGVRGEAFSDNSNSDADALYGGYFRASSAADSGSITAAIAVRGEVEIPVSSGDVYGTTYAFLAEIDNNSGIAQTNTTYLYYGNYSGTLPTDARGIYIQDDVPNYLGGDLEVAGDSLTVDGNEVLHEGSVADTLGFVDGGVITAIAEEIPYDEDIGGLSNAMASFASNTELRITNGATSPMDLDTVLGDVVFDGVDVTLYYNSNTSSVVITPDYGFTIGNDYYFGFNSPSTEAGTANGQTLSQITIETTGALKDRISFGNKTEAWSSLNNSPPASGIILIGGNEVAISNMSAKTYDAGNTVTVSMAKGHGIVVGQYWREKAATADPDSGLISTDERLALKRAQESLTTIESSYAATGGKVSFSPSLTTDGTVTAYYQVLGKQVHIRIEVKMTNGQYLNLSGMDMNTGSARSNIFLPTDFGAFEGLTVGSYLKTDDTTYPPAITNCTFDNVVCKTNNGNNIMNTPANYVSASGNDIVVLECFALLA